jgi:dihydrofolate reductase
MRMIVSFVHVSLDGFVASTAKGPAGLGWISRSADLFEYVEKRIQQTDTALYGRTTFEMMESYWPPLPMNPMPARMITSIHAGINRPAKWCCRKLCRRKITLIRKSSEAI